MKTLAQQLNIKSFPFEIHVNGKEVYHENSNGYWVKREYDANGKRVYIEDSDGYWEKSEYDANGNNVYFEESNGYIEDKRPKEFSMDEIEPSLVKLEFE